MRRLFISDRTAMVGSGKAAISRPSFGRKGRTRANTLTFPRSSCTRLCSLRRWTSPARSFSSYSAMRRASVLPCNACASVSSCTRLRITSSSPVTLPSFSTDSWLTEAFSSSVCSCCTSFSSPAATSFWRLRSSATSSFCWAMARSWLSTASSSVEFFSSISRMRFLQSDSMASSCDTAAMRSRRSASSRTSQRIRNSFSTSSCITLSLDPFISSSC
mmetsp:Transcript_13170/g.22042  ORF Transcript_13170/g.22042 Transcript_13170/m.22042 type:complete len:217 (+) Transcript_13170:226-876(+)